MPKRIIETLICDTCHLQFNGLFDPTAWYKCNICGASLSHSQEDRMKPLAIDTRTCRERQDDAIATIEATIENLERRIAALEAQRTVRVPISGTVIWDTGQVTWGEFRAPAFVHSPGYPAQEDAT